MQASVKRVISAALALVLYAAWPATASHSAVQALGDNASVADECHLLLAPASARRAMQLVRAQLQSQGMALLVQACPFVRVSAKTLLQVVDVRVRVIHSEVAADFVRGPLADGEELDMGSVHLSPPRVVQEGGKNALSTAPEDVSPDVLFNREWLAKVMQNRGLRAVHGHWWAFVPAAPRP